MTVRMTISLPDALAAQVEALVASGKYASNSDAIRAGLRALEEAEERRQREREEHEARLEAVRADLQKRAEGPFISLDELDAFIDGLFAEDTATAAQNAA